VTTAGNSPYTEILKRAIQNTVSSKKQNGYQHKEGVCKHDLVFERPWTLTTLQQIDTNGDNCNNYDKTMILFSWNIYRICDVVRSKHPLKIMWVYF